MADACEPVSPGGGPRPVPGESLGRRLATFRRRAGLSQREVGRRLGRVNSVVSRWEGGGLEPTLAELDMLARILDVRVADTVSAVGLAPRGRRWSNRAVSRSLRVAVGARLRRHRLDASLSVADVYQRAGVGGLRLARIEAGADPCLAELVPLATLLALDLDGLIRAAKLDRTALLANIGGPFDSHPTRPTRALGDQDPTLR